MADIDVLISPDFEAACVAAALPFLRTIQANIYNDLQRDVPRDTGRLAASMFSDLDEVTGTISFGATAPHAIFVEFGHHTEDGSWVEPEPFIRRTAYKRRGEFK